jgi:hypothetical protein
MTLGLSYPMFTSLISINSRVEEAFSKEFDKIVMKTYLKIFKSFLNVWDRTKKLYRKLNSVK